MSDNRVTLLDVADHMHTLTPGERREFDREAQKLGKPGEPDPQREPLAEAASQSPLPPAAQGRGRVIVPHTIRGRGEQGGYGITPTGPPALG